MERKSFQGRGRGGFDQNDREPRKMYRATCSDCGQETEVPFMPDPDRPVYCRDCLPKHRKPRKF
ncbi:hypothetical protein FTO70_13020 [Methanosarcina sp. KYL-1]|uniref:CxxC-x17-CxxC domain-containing protein n=1 Tax=Methanosarcina sp. KYL-1 TaxID=2602068 RepID=UPI0021013A16|nr:CxxC-x17-CxxC domain-containing protein [Methanosarcina sp. KYL-1]MCQ1536575.1 hypothetical protein [Methanosarcina sp. KYL-1]